MPRLSPIVEFRQYTMVPGGRDDFVDIFDREFIESQEVLGISVIGQFRDLDREDRYVWMRGFPDMEARRTALTSFYTGPVWAEHKDAANATMTEWDDVLLLRPVEEGDLAVDPADRPAAGDRAPGRMIEAVVVPVAGETVESVTPGLAARLSAAISGAGGDLLGTFVTEPSPNTYPRLPIREGVSVIFCISAFSHATAAASAGDDWRARLRGPMRLELADATRLRLAPTPRSLLR